MFKRRWVQVLLGVLGTLLLVLLTRAALMRPSASDHSPKLSLPSIDPDAAVARFAAALQIPTISVTDTHGDPETFRQLHALLQREFPRVHAELSRRTVNEFGLVYRWPGTDDTALPILLLAHMDVVPIEPGTEQDWGQPPFSGAVVDGEIWGRGAMDDKTAVMAIMESVEALLAEGFVPERTIVLAFGHDEEIGGRNGARAIAKTFADAGMRFELILDEGGVVVDGSIPGVTVPVALIGVAEKGYASLELVAVSDGGHSSMPASDGVVARLSRAVRRLDEHQMAARLDGPTRTMLETIGPHMPFGMRIGVANLWLLKRALIAVMLGKPPGAASVRTTTAPTMFEAGTKDNVLPQHGRAVVNFRILPGDTVESVIAHARAVIGDPSVEVQCLGECWDPSEPSPTDTHGYAQLKRSILQTFGDLAVAPYLVVGATDARHYQHLGVGTYRFLPLLLLEEHRSRLHGTGERIKVEAYLQAIRFYSDLLQRASRG
ncbi:MAG: M20 family peptidase [Nannocystaceae bacterium]|nr:M20 family peptidase [Nannocystaceae bacterium]